MLDRLSEDFSFLQKSIALRAQRQEVLSSNIANADTPGYQARDFDFKEAMQGAVNKRMALAPTNLATTAPRHIPGTVSSNLLGGAELQYRLPYQASLDGNTVDMDIERVQFADNTLQMQAGMQILTGRIRTMMSAIQE